jgi:hypothetical protein
MLKMSIIKADYRCCVPFWGQELCFD